MNATQNACYKRHKESLSFEGGQQALAFIDAGNNVSDVIARS